MANGNDQVAVGVVAINAFERGIGHERLPVVVERDADRLLHAAGALVAEEGDGLRGGIDDEHAANSFSFTDSRHDHPVSSGDILT